MLKKLIRSLVKWHWHDASQEWRLSITPLGKTRATVFPNGCWHTWDKHGSGGENSSETTVQRAKSEAYYSLVKQEWI